MLNLRTMGYSNGEAIEMIENQLHDNNAKFFKNQWVTVEISDGVTAISQVIDAEKTEDLSDIVEMFNNRK